MSNKKSHAKRKNVPTISLGPLVGHRYHKDGPHNGEDTERKPGYDYQHFGDTAYSTLRDYEVNKLIHLSRKGEIFSGAYLYHFSDDWVKQFEEMLSRGGFQELDSDGWLFAALCHASVNNVNVARAILARQMTDGGLTSGAAEEYGERNIPGGSFNLLHFVWSSVVQEAHESARECTAERLQKMLPERDAGRRVRI